MVLQVDRDDARHRMAESIGDRLLPDADKMMHGAGSQGHFLPFHLQPHIDALPSHSRASMRSTTHLRAVPSPPHSPASPKGCGGPPPGSGEPCFLPAHKPSLPRSSRCPADVPSFPSAMRSRQSPPSMCRATPGQSDCVLRALRPALPWPEPASNGISAQRPPRPPRTAARKTTKPDRNTAADKQQGRLPHRSMRNRHCARPPENDNGREEVFDNVQPLDRVTVQSRSYPSSL